MNESLFSRIKSLPPLPESVIKIQTICNDPNAAINDLTKVVENDPMLTANLLKAANSPLYGFSREIKALAQAVSLFGMATVRGFALASAVKSTLKIDMSPYSLTAEQFANTSQLQNALMVKWYSQVDRSKLEVLSPSSFLISVGRIIIAQEIVKLEQTEKFKSIVEEKGSFEEAEDELLEISYQEVSSQVFKHWHFEPAMVDAIFFSQNPADAYDEIKPLSEALSVVQAAVTLSNGITEESIKTAKELVEKYNLDVEKFEKIANTLI